MADQRIKTLLRQLKTKLRGDPDRFLTRSSGVVHVGANIGQERDVYEKFGIPVLWIEPIPEVFRILETNVQGYRKQLAVQSLVTDKDDAEYRFNISNNTGESSSILDLKLHRDIWPEVTYDRTIALRSTTLASLFASREIDLRLFDTLVLDTQGSELLVLKGAVPILHAFKFVKAEVPDFEAYANCCRLVDIDLFLREHGFREFSRDKFAELPQGGNYYNVVYQRRRK